MLYKKSLGIERHNMPQIEAKNVPIFLEWLMIQTSKPWKKEAVRVGSLLPTQKEYNPEKVKNMMNAPDEVLTKPIIVSSDNYILDGHHRYSAMLEKNPFINFEIFRVDLDIKELLEYADRFPLTFKKGLNEKISFLQFQKRFI